MIPPRPRRNKYGNRPVGTHASKKEHARAAQLALMQRAGIITDLREQVPFELIPSQFGTCGTDLRGRPVRLCIERSCKYIADFVYRDVATDTLIVEDTKGVRTPDYIIKRKLMLYIHGIQIKEI